MEICVCLGLPSPHIWGKIATQSFQFLYCMAPGSWHGTTAQVWYNGSWYGTIANGTLLCSCSCSWYCTIAHGRAMSHATKL
jgi:hypothetical protein